MPRHTFRISVLGRYQARLPSNESAVTANLIAGNDGHLIYCGTITMTEGQFETFTRALADSLEDDFELEETRVPGAPGRSSPEEEDRTGE